MEALPSLPLQSSEENDMEDVNYNHSTNGVNPTFRTKPTISPSSTAVSNIGEVYSENINEKENAETILKKSRAPSNDLQSTSTVTSVSVSGTHSTRSSSYGTDEADMTQGVLRHSNDQKQHEHILFSTPCTSATGTTTTTTTNSTIDEDLQSNHSLWTNSSKKGGLPRCAVVNFHKDGDTLKWAPRVSHNVSGLPARVHNFEDAFTLEEFSSTALPVVWHATGGNPRNSTATTPIIVGSPTSPPSSTSTFAAGPVSSSLKSYKHQSSLGVDEDSTNTRLVVRFSKGSVPLAIQPKLDDPILCTTEQNPNYPLLASKMQSDSDVNGDMNIETGTKLSKVFLENRNKRLSSIAAMDRRKDDEHVRLNHKNNENLGKKLVFGPANPPSEAPKQSLWSVLIQGNRNNGKGRARGGRSQEDSMPSIGRRARKVAARRRSTFNNSGEDMNDAEGSNNKKDNEINIKRTDIRRRNKIGDEERINKVICESSPTESAAVKSHAERVGINNSKRPNDGHGNTNGRRRLLRKWGGVTERRKSRLVGNSGTEEEEVISTQKGSIESNLATGRNRQPITSRHSISARPQVRHADLYEHVQSDATHRILKEQQENGNTLRKNDHNELDRGRMEWMNNNVRAGERQGAIIGDRIIRRQEEGRIGRMASKRLQQPSSSEKNGDSNSGGRMLEMISGRRSRSSLGDGVLRRKLSHDVSTVRDNDDQYLSFITSVV